MVEERDFIINGLNVIGERGGIEEGYVLVRNGKIKEFGRVSGLSDNIKIKNYVFPKNYNLIPGMIDVHIHGANGADVMDATTHALDIISSSLPMEGTTSFLATTITQSKEAIENALINISEYKSKGSKRGSSEILGVHLEGPFISPKKAGAQPLNYIEQPSVRQFEHYQRASNNLIKLITLAPEEDQDFALTKHLKKTGVIVSMGHTNASYALVEKAIEAGVSHVTHLFNAMTGLHHRDPGVVGAALSREELMTELIVDGVHSHPLVINLAYQMKGKDHLVMITDAMRAKCLKNGDYDLGGQTVKVIDGKAELRNGQLAGSVLRMIDGVKNMLKFTNASIEEIVHMTSTNPAKELHLFDRIGSIAVGKDADLVVLDEEYNVVMTFCKGEIAYEKERF